MQISLLLKKVVVLSLLCIFSQCTKSEEENVLPLEMQLSSDPIFNALVNKSLQISDMYIKQFSSFSTEKRGKLQNRLKEFQQKESMTETEYLEAAKVMGYNNSSTFFEDLKEINRLKIQLLEKYPEIAYTENKAIIEKAVKSCDRFKSDPNIKLMGGNCDGIYHACVTVVGITAVAAVVACGPGAGFCAYGVAAIAGAAMELCRQEAIGCNQQ